MRMFSHKMSQQCYPAQTNGPIGEMQTDSFTSAKAGTDTGDASAEARSGSGSNVEDGADASVRSVMLGVA
jgi:hypothetical protein